VSYPSKYGPGWVNTVSNTAPQDARIFPGVEVRALPPSDSIQPQGVVRNHHGANTTSQDLRQDFSSRCASSFVSLTKIFVKDKQFSGNCLDIGGNSLEDVKNSYLTACAHLHVLPNIVENLVGVVLRGSALKYFNKLHPRDKVEVHITFDAVRVRFLPGNMVRATEQTWETYTWNQLLLEYPPITEPSSLVELLVEKGEALQDRPPAEYKSDVHLRNWLVKSISGTVFKKNMPVTRSDKSTGVAVEIGKSLELYREEYSRKTPTFGAGGRFPRRFSSSAPPSILYGSEEIKAPGLFSTPDSGIDAYELCAEDLAEVEAIYMAEPGYRTP
jgi:hypothetical protein